MYNIEQLRRYVPAACVCVCVCDMHQLVGRLAYGQILKFLFLILFTAVKRTRQFYIYYTTFRFSLFDLINLTRYNFMQREYIIYLMRRKSSVYLHKSCVSVLIAIEKSLIGVTRFLNFIACCI